MTAQELRTRIKAYAYRCAVVAESLPQQRLASDIFSRQLIRSAFSGSNNYRAATRSQSKAQFLSKLNIALEEVDESICDLKLMPAEKLADLKDEAGQIVKILGASKHTLQLQLNKKNPKPIQNEENPHTNSEFSEDPV